MAVQMIEGIERPVQRESVGLCRGDADDKAADQAGTTRYRDTVEIRKTRVRALQRVFDHCGEQRDMPPAGDFGNDAAVLRMKGILVGRNAREHVAPIANHCRGSVVAGRFDCKREHAEANWRLGGAAL